ncbi:MAG: SGNH hydrolase domain-containing protein, partial [Chloroflexota bacterium]
LAPIDRTEPSPTPGRSSAVPSAPPSPSPAPAASATPAPLTRAEMERVLAELGPVPQGIDWKAAREYDSTVWTCPPGKVRECLVVDGTGPTVLFVGDSSARTLMPVLTKLAKERGFRLYASILPACSWMAGVRRPDVSVDAACVAQRESWYARAVPAIAPDVLLLHERGYRETVDESTARAADPAVDALPIDARERTLATRTLDLLAPLVPAIVILEPFPTDYGADPTECLASSRRIATCAFLDRPVRIEGTLRELATGYPDVRLVDLDRVVCPTYPLCVPYQDGRVIWRDGTHVATGTWETRRREVWQALRSTGAFAGADG